MHQIRVQGILSFYGCFKVLEILYLCEEKKEKTWKKWREREREAKHLYLVVTES